MISVDEFRESYINEDINAQAVNTSRYPIEVFIENASIFFRMTIYWLAAWSNVTMNTAGVRRACELMLLIWICRPTH